MIIEVFGWIIVGLLSTGMIATALCLWLISREVRRR